MDTFQNGRSRMSTTSDEKKLVRRILKGDQAAFRELYETHEKALARVGWYFLGDDDEVSDVLQETFLRGLEHLPSFRFECSLATWLNHIAANLCRRILEKRKKNVPVDGEYFNPFVSRKQESPYPPEAMEYLREEMEALEGRDKDLIRLREIEGCSYEAIAGRLRIPLGSVTSGIHRARRRLIERVRERLGNTPGGFSIPAAEGSQEDFSLRAGPSPQAGKEEAPL
jgi:RNA polymerase sigma-70 factor, ECF subfamily